MEGPGLKIGFRERRGTRVASIHYQGRAPSQPRFLTEDAQEAIEVAAPANELAALSIRGVNKSFGGRGVLHDINLDIERGEIHALLGANGSGKSTLIKILSGYHKPQQGGEVLVEGRSLAFGSSRMSEQVGLRFIHQDLGLFDGLTVTENLMLGMNHHTRWVSDRRDQKLVAELLDTYGVVTDPRAAMLGQAPASRTMLAIVRAIESGLGRGGVLVLDEPTASLPPQEVDTLFRLVRGLRDQGVTILFVTHRLQEVFEVADRVSVLRNGTLISTSAVADIGRDGLIEMILGKPLAPVAQPMSHRLDSPTLSVTELSGDTVTDASFSAYEGEVLGVTGLMGAGYEALLGLVFGAVPRSRGQVVILNQQVTASSPAAAISAGIAFAPADRHRLGSFGGWTVRENVTIPALRTRMGWLSERSESVDSAGWLDRLGVTPKDPNIKFSALSGGNQQKVVLARWLRCGAKVLLLDEPTIGVDAGAKQLIHQELRSLAAAGAVVVLSSSDTEEICEVCDRVLIMSGGQISAELHAPLTTDEIFSATQIELSP
jgi:ribose transport system ATP-binding protein